MEKKRGRPRKQNYPTCDELVLQFKAVPYPVFFVDRRLEVFGANEYAHEHCRPMTLPDGLRSILPEGSSQECSLRLEKGENFRVELPLFQAGRTALAFSPVREKDKVIGGMVMVTPVEGQEHHFSLDMVADSTYSVTALLNDVAGQVSSAISPLRYAIKFKGETKYQDSFSGVLREVYRLRQATKLLEVYLSPTPDKDAIALEGSWGVVDFWDKTADLLDSSDVMLKVNPVPFNFQLPPRGNARVYCSYERIALAILALIDNSFQHGRPENQVLVTGENTPEGVRIKVIDQGRGIPPEELGQVFTPFYSRGVGGEPLLGHHLGLGLTVARQIIYEHGGAMAIESVPGEGTTVAFTLPVIQEPLTQPVVVKSDRAEYLEDHFSAPHVQLHRHIKLPF